MKPFASDHLYFTPLGGCGEIGMNLSIYTENARSLIVDCGIGFDRALGVDVIMPDLAGMERVPAPEAIVITHGHEDHIGALPYLYEYLELPIYATPFTAYLIREKLRDVKLLSRAKIHEVKPLAPFEVAGSRLTYIPITHSIPESHVLKIETAHGVIVHTGDWKLDKTPLVDYIAEAEIKALAQSRPLALVCDSTNVFQEGESGSEQLVHESLQELIARQQQRVVVTCFASNISRLLTCIAAAKQSKREIILSGRSLWRMLGAAQHVGLIDQKQKFYHDEAFQDLDPEKTLMICTGSQGEGRAALTRIARGSHPKVKLVPGDTVIYSSREIPGNERDIQETQDRLIDAGVVVITDNDVLTHVSGHPCRDELRQMYDWTQPHALVPVHGERAHIREHAAFGKECGIPQCLEPTNGGVYCLTDHAGPRQVGNVPHGRLALDGAMLVPVDDLCLQERHKLMTEGCIMITLKFQANKTNLMEILITQLGLPEPGQEGTLLHDIEYTVREAVTGLSRAKLRSDDEVVNVTARAVQRTSRALLKKRPEVIVHCVR